MNVRMNNSLLILILSMLFSCGGDSSEDSPVTLPSGLEFDVVVSDNGSGQVTVSAEAVNANFYSVYFGQSSSETPVKTNTGIAAYTYTAAGTYSIRVLAHATAAHYIESTEEISVALGSSNSGEIVIPATGFTSPETYAGMTKVWEDNFNGTALNTSDWTYETGRGTNGWGNNELQFYRQENTKVEDGYLIITAKKENFSDAAYTSSRLKTQGKREFKYGRIDIRAALPRGQGIWPALWLLGGNFSTAGWPACGEIDLMEMIGGSPNRDNTVHGTVHWDNNGSYASYTGHKTISSGVLGDEFHVYSIVWTAQSITWYLDNVQFNVIDTQPAALSEFHQNYFLIFNVAVGGNWPGSPDAATSFPQHLIVDYIRVFQ
jgi:beta-glucanase (GH16 family)